MLEVAAAANAVLTREPATSRQLLAQDFGVPEESAFGWACALAGLHDLGKASPAFQQKWPPGRNALPSQLTFEHPHPPPHDTPHGAITYIALSDELRARGWKPKAARLIADAVSAHHGWRIDAAAQDQACLPRELGEGAWDEARGQLVELVLAGVGVGEPPSVETLDAAAFMRLAGLTSFADWIGSSLDPEIPGDDIVAFYREAVGRAERALDNIGWMERTPLFAESTPFEKAFAYLAKDGSPVEPSELQQAVAQLADGAGAPILLIIEAPMGAGKTEAALQAHLALQRRLGHRGLYIALPTQATGNAMFDRVHDFLAHVPRAVHGPLDLQLLHGATLLAPAYQKLQVRSGDGAEDPVTARRWFTHRKRALLSEYGVGTVDQALLSCMHVKHQFVRLWGLGNRTVVLDEVHAYDTYTSGLITTMVGWLAALGSSVIVMSATLPDTKRTEILKAFGGDGAGPNADYPRVTAVAAGQTPTSLHVSGTRASSVSLESTGLDTAGIADLLVSLTAKGGLAGCIVNTVGRAQDLYRELQSRRLATPIHLFHARYPVDERQRREQETLERFGKHVPRPGCGILVATQVAEQSLDLDFDVMVTDLAPVDLLLQRAGRMHRHDRPLRQRSGHRVPRLYVAGLERGEQPPDIETTYFEAIYDRAILLRTWAALRERTSVAFPSDIDALVQLVYGPDDIPGTPEGVRGSLAESEAARATAGQVERAEAESAVIGHPWERRWRQTPPASNRVREDGEPERLPLAPTRLGDERITVIVLHEHPDGVTIDPAGSRPAQLAGILDPQHARELYGRSLSLSHKGVVEALRRTGVPEAWRRDPLLYNCFALRLRNGEARFGRTVVRWDDELGLCIRRE